VNEAIAAIDPKRTALLVMDFQQGVVALLPDPEPLLARAADALAAVRAAGARVGYVRVAFTAAEAAAMPATNKMAARVRDGGDMLRDGAPATQIHPAVAPHDGDIVVRKTRVGPFLTTDLDEQLRGHGIDTLILAGISTSGVVLSTVRDGADRDYRLLVLSDACADPRPDVHAFLTTEIFPRQADVIPVTDLRALLGT
jgi:nicotinamidase-related amidase